MAFALFTFGYQNVKALEVYVLRDPPNNQTSPGIVSYSSIGNFRSNTGGTTTNRGSGTESSCDFAIVNGAVYSIGGDATATGNKNFWTWPSVTDWSTNSGGSGATTRENAAPMSGMAFYQGSVYVLEGSMNSIATKTLKRWNSIAAWGNESDPGVTIGSRNTGSGIGFDIAADGVVYFIDTSNSSPNTATSGTLYSWPSINDFLNDIGTNNGGSFTFFAGSPNEIAGLAVVPEPSTWALVSVAGLILAGLDRRRRKIRA